MKKINRCLTLLLMSFGLVLSGCNSTDNKPSSPNGNDDVNNNQNDDNNNLDSKIKVEFTNVTHNSFDYKVLGTSNVKFDLISFFKDREIYDGTAYSSKKSSDHVTNLEAGTYYSVLINYKVDGVFYTNKKYFVETKDDPSAPIKFDKKIRLIDKVYYKITPKDGVDLSSLKVSLLYTYPDSEIQTTKDGYLNLDRYDLDDVVTIKATINHEGKEWLVRTNLLPIDNQLHRPKLAVFERLSKNEGYIIENYTPSLNNPIYDIEYLYEELSYEGEKISKDDYTFKVLENNKYELTNMISHPRYELSLYFNVVHKETKVKEIYQAKLELYYRFACKFEVFTTTNSEIKIIDKDTSNHSYEIYDDETHNYVGKTDYKTSSIGNLDPKKVYSIVKSESRASYVRHICPSKCYEYNVVSLNRVEPHNVELKINEQFDFDQEIIYKINKIAILDYDNNNEIFKTTKIDKKIIVPSLTSNHKYKLHYEYEFNNSDKKQSVTKEHTFTTNKEDIFEPHFKYLNFTTNHGLELAYSIDSNFIDSNYKLNLLNVTCYNKGFEKESVKYYEYNFSISNSSSNDNYLDLEVEYQILKNGEVISQNTKIYHVQNGTLEDVIHASLIIHSPSEVGTLSCEVSQYYENMYKYHQLRIYENDFDIPTKIINGVKFKYKFNTSGILLVELYGRSDENEHWRKIESEMFNTKDIGLGW